MVINQQKMASTLKQVDHYGMMLTVATALYGVGFLAYFMYVGLQSGRM